MVLAKAVRARTLRNRCYCITIAQSFSNDGRAQVGAGEEIKRAVSKTR